MYIGHKKLELNKWQFRFILEKSPYWLIGFAPHILIHFAKIHTKPPEGSMILKSHYKGFIWDYTVPLYRLRLEVRRVWIAKRSYVYWVDTFWE